MQQHYLTAITVLVSNVLISVCAAREDLSQQDRQPTTPENVPGNRREAESRDNFQIHAGWHPLFNGRNLDGWSTSLQRVNGKADGDRNIAIENNRIRLSGDPANGTAAASSYIVTDKEYGDYHLRLQYRWAEQRPEPRSNAPCNARVFYHVIKVDGVSPIGLQCQIRDGGAGDLLVPKELTIDSWIDPATKEQKSPTFQDAKRGGTPLVLRGGSAPLTRSIMNELAGWNTLEIIAFSNQITHVLNGKTVNRCENVQNIDAANADESNPINKGRIALQVDAAEIEFRNIEIKHLDVEASAGPHLVNPIPPTPDVRVGASAVNLRSDSTMAIGGGIEPQYAAEQEGELRAVATVIERPGHEKLAIVACDVVFVPREVADAAVAEIEAKTRIPADHVLINATHTHHAPATAAVHGYEGAPEFCKELQRGIVTAVEEANRRLDGGDANLFFHLSSEDTIGSNSRQLLEDGSITWTGQQEPGAKAKPTGPFDPQLPVLDFRDVTGKSRALLFNHSTHTIGTRSGRIARSPSFYGLAAQELEAELGGIVSFLEGASGSTHNVAPKVPVAECIERLKLDIREARSTALPRKIDKLFGIRRRFKFRIRHFNEDEEDTKVAKYLKKHVPQAFDRFREVFANMRRQLRKRQGAEQETWVQAIVIGDIAIVGVPAELFTVLGIEIKRRSPFEHTYIAELANDWIGYLPDREAHRLGGYQTWMGLHSYADPGTGERMVDEVVHLLDEIAADRKAIAESTFRAADSEVAVLDKESAGSARPQSPIEEQTSFQVADPNLRIELVASEPDVVSPVGIAWDADARMYVAEMSGYPATEGMGRIRRLEDWDGDGRYEHAVTFCDGLNFPTSVMPYRAGVLVTDAPDILYLEDSDGDGRADVRRVEWTGFGTGSQQLRANSLHWNLDNWIYLANGRCDGSVRRPDSTEDSAIAIRARDFRFHPVSNEGQAVIGQSQFGQAHDAWGNRFLSWNTIPIRHVLLEATDVSRYPAAATEAVLNISDPGDTGRVYPISSPPRQFNKQQANYYNALCGITILNDDTLGEVYANSAFICESLSNLVTRRKLEPTGPTFVARRADNEKDREFLASTDSWFHPVNLSVGPDGALYVVDFYRQFVEHPIYVADEKVRAEVNWRNGARHGRIWRIRRDNGGLTANLRPSLSRASSSELVEVLGHSIAWWRNTAQRLLVERQDRTVLPQLRTMLAESKSPMARLHALYVLDGIDVNAAPPAIDEPDASENPQPLDVTSLRLALSDSEATVRRQAVRLAAQRLNDGDDAGVCDQLLQMASDPEASVRFQLALTLGSLNDGRVPRSLATLLSRDDSTYLRLGVLCGLSQHSWPLVRELLADVNGASQKAIFLEQVSEQFALHASDHSLVESLDWLTGDFERANEDGRLATLAGISRGLFARNRSLNNPTADERLGENVTSRVRESIAAALALALDVSQSPENRRRATIIAASAAPTDVERMVRELVESSQPQSVQMAALWSATQVNVPGAWQDLFNRWNGHTTSTRAILLDQSLHSTAGSDALISALEADILSAQELSGNARERLQQVRDESLRRRAVPLLSEIASANRDKVIARYAGVDSRRGNSAQGAAIFKQSCQSCHAIQGIGHKVGPDLTSVASRPTDSLIMDILDPSRQVPPDYINYILFTKDGRSLSGLIAAETTESLTLRRENGQQDTIPRSNIEQLRATGKSLMPDGFELQLSREQLTDLLEYLHNPDVNLLK